ncbi:MAG: hypothetical protein NZM12_07510, partial [Steroidobacteraceae bacterium]|nr:hypothetical protein [Steroidobacteraceae bacterium]MDW8259686.1 hypothetical protein [Gammaproteobacteria bacterium]
LFRVCSILRTGVQAVDAGSYVAAKLAHLLLFVYWLGADIGVFYAAAQLRRRELTLDARQAVLRILTWIDQIPRYSLVLMLPVGYTLANEIGVVRLQRPWIVATWLVGVVWLWLVWAVYRWQGTALGERLRRIDLAWRFILVPGLLWDALQALIGKGHLLTPWLGAKVGVLGLCIACGIAIRILGRPLTATLRDLFAHGSTPQLEERLVATQRRTRPFVLAIWLLLIVAAWLGIAKPSFGL